MTNKNSTIAALASPHGVGGISVIRVSGENAIDVAQRIFSPAKKIPLSHLQGYQAAYGTIMDSLSPVDEAVCLVFRAPHSYTGEDVVEISCHGGQVISKKILSLLFENGAQPAEAGEFTKRAFLNGKLDLTEAEAVMTMIGAQGEQGTQVAIGLLKGSLGKKISGCSSKLVTLCAGLSAWVDFPDDEIEEADDINILKTITDVSSTLCELLRTFDSGRAVTQGIPTVIAGRPNVGKSTLMNLLSGCERAIVTDIAGTTRDVISDTVNLGGIILNLSDTAGIRQTDERVEKIGVERALECIESSELILAVFDGSEQLTPDDISIIKACKNKRMIIIINKTDLEMKLSEKDFEDIGAPIIFMSAKEESGYNELEHRVKTMFSVDTFDPGAAVLINERQRDCCKKAQALLEQAACDLKSGVTLDAVQVLLESAIEQLLMLTGQAVSETVVNEIFSSFCVGK